MGEWTIVILTNEGGIGRRVEQLTFNSRKAASAAAMWLKRAGKSDLNIALFDDRPQSEGTYDDITKG